MQRQKAQGVRGRMLHRGPVLNIIVILLSVYSPLLHHLCLHGFQACCFWWTCRCKHGSVCGRTYERTSVSISQGELRGDCLSISCPVCDISDMTATIKLIRDWIHLSESAVKACLQVNPIRQERSLWAAECLIELNMQVQPNCYMDHIALADTVLYDAHGHLQSLLKSLYFNMMEYWQAQMESVYVLCFFSEICWILQNMKWVKLNLLLP